MTVELVTPLPLGFAIAVLLLGLGYMLDGTIGDEMGSGFKGHRLDNRIQQLQARVLELERQQTRLDFRMWERERRQSQMIVLPPLRR